MRRHRGKHITDEGSVPVRSRLLRSKSILLLLPASSSHLPHHHEGDVIADIQTGKTRVSYWYKLLLNRTLTPSVERFFQCLRGKLNSSCTKCCTSTHRLVFSREVTTDCGSLCIAGKHLSSLSFSDFCLSPPPVPVIPPSSLRWWAQSLPGEGDDEQLLQIPVGPFLLYDVFLYQRTNLIYSLVPGLTLWQFACCSGTNNSGSPPFIFCIKVRFE